MIDHLVGLGHLEQGASFVTLLPTNGPIRGSRVLLTRDGFLSPSLDGGLPLFELFRPSRRSSSAIRAFRAATSAACAATSAISSSRDGSLRESAFGFIESLNRKLIPLSRKKTT
jgi:hypothetical protein